MGNMSAATVPSSWTSIEADATQKFYVADLVDTGGSSSGSTLCAAWTGLTGGTNGVAVIATFKLAGVASTAPRLLQMSYTDSAILQSAGMTAWTAQAYPVNPAKGSTLVLFANGSIIHPSIVTGSVASVTDTASNKWVFCGESGPDQKTAINISAWLCRSALGGATTPTVNFTNNSQQLACLLLEFANMNGPLVLDRSTYITNSGNDTPNMAVTALAGDLAIAFRTFILGETLKGPTGSWQQIMSDTTGAWALMQRSTAAGTLTATWSGTQNATGVDADLVAFTSASSLGLH
jgi:hypothetical protein